ncbi:hypothetical protein WMY93_007764 [Mugilogobius chulae]|uniref:Uncharacterized protein n=1 Tax=Mugilogobius chulae TaxID=88201 RepID=A0AAW0PSI2_9GOBI
MGSVSRGRWRGGVWGFSNGMARLLAAVLLLSLVCLSAARPPLTAAKDEETTEEPEAEQSVMPECGRRTWAVKWVGHCLYWHRAGVPFPGFTHAAEESKTTSSFNTFSITQFF